MAAFVVHSPGQATGVSAVGALTVSEFVLSVRLYHNLEGLKYPNIEYLWFLYYEP